MGSGALPVSDVADTVGTTAEPAAPDTAMAEPAASADAAMTEPAAPTDAETAPIAPVPAPQPERLPLAQAIARLMAAAGTRFAFTVPGESFLPLLQALPDAGIRVVATRHEGAASFAAEAATQLTGKPQLLLVTRTVGLANAAIDASR